MNDQSIKADAGKARLDLVPHGIIWAIARIREYGCNKYPGSTENWRNVEIWRYRAAAFRHLLRYLEDPQGVDDESGLPHLHHLACNVAFLIDLEAAEAEDEKKTHANARVCCENCIYNPCAIDVANACLERDGCYFTASKYNSGSMDCQWK